VAALRDGQRRYPADFWINEYLGWLLLQNVESPQPKGAGKTFSPQLETDPGRDLAFRGHDPLFSSCVGSSPAVPRGPRESRPRTSSQGRRDEAIACYREAIRLKPEYGQAHANLGHALMEQTKWAEAEAAYRKALALKVKLAECALLDLGVVLHHQGKRVEAEPPSARPLNSSRLS